MSYATLSYYADVYSRNRKSAIEPNDFPFYAMKATQIIKRYMGGKVYETDPPECVKMCCCEIAEILYTCEQKRKTYGITSEKVGDLSVNYESTQSAAEAEERKIKQAIYLWLADTGLLYRGA